MIDISINMIDLKIKKLERRVAELEAKQPKPYFKDGVAIRELEEDAEYFTIYSYGYVGSDTWIKSTTDKNRLKTGSVFETKKAAEKELERRKKAWRELCKQQ